MSDLLASTQDVSGKSLAQELLATKRVSPAGGSLALASGIRLESGSGLEGVHQPGIGDGNAGHRIAAFRSGLDLQRTTAGRQGEQQELAIAAIADAGGSDVLGFALVLDAHLEQERAADRFEGATDDLDEFIFGNGFGVGHQIGLRDIGCHHIGQTFSKRIFEGFVVELRVHATPLSLANRAPPVNQR
ncbi:hypothetical protein NMG46_28320 [Mesorhizobium sp. LMG 17147]|nr:hypothetical protein [Mesorhizobium sp. LMG 17147]MCP9234062.1 hypothetical protein [Mesorhizobium sp. LMG 17147]